MRARSSLLAVSAGLALADASIVTLALPELLVQLDTTIEGVAAVIGVYTVVLAAALLPAERLARTHGSPIVGAAGFALFAVASLACAAADSLPVLLVARGVQAIGGAAALVAVFALLDGGRGNQRRLWLGAAVLSTAVGPALGGAITQVLSWEWIFVVQAPVAAVAAAVCARTQPVTHAWPDHQRVTVRPAVALALLSAALTAVVFLLVLLLVAGWAVDPLRAAAAVTVLPLAAVAGSRFGGDARTRASAGCALVGTGTVALAYLPDADLLWTVGPQLLAGFGMGLALPALGGELLPERTPRDAARLLVVRHAGIALALVLLAPITADRLQDATQSAREQGVALVLDAELEPTRKLDLAPALLAGVKDDRPRAGLRRTLAEVQGGLDDDGERATVAALGARADDTLVSAVGESFFAAFLITGLLALVAAICVLPGGRTVRWVGVAAAIGCVAVVAQVVAFRDRAPSEVAIRDPCDDRALPGTGGITGFLQDRALELLDRNACTYGSSREELVLALADDEDRERFEDEHGVDPRSVGGILGGLLG